MICAKSIIIDLLEYYACITRCNLVDKFYVQLALYQYKNRKFISNTHDQSICSIFEDDDVLMLNMNFYYIMRLEFVKTTHKQERAVQEV